MSQRCPDERPHGPHRVRARYRKHLGAWVFTYGFQCAGHDPADFDRLLDKAFGPK